MFPFVPLTKGTVKVPDKLVSFVLFSQMKLPSPQLFASCQSYGLLKNFLSRDLICCFLCTMQISLMIAFSFPSLCKHYGHRREAIQIN